VYRTATTLARASSPADLYTVRGERIARHAGAAAPSPGVYVAAMRENGGCVKALKGWQ